MLRSALTFAAVTLGSLVSAVAIPAPASDAKPSFEPKMYKGYYGPVMEHNFADPAMMRVDGRWFGYATTGGGPHVNMAHSDDFKTWHKHVHDPFPIMPEWCAGIIWAPHVMPSPAGKGYVLYYSGKSKKDGVHCVGAAYSDSPTGNFTGEAEPLACHIQQGGAIDPAGFVDSDGTPYVVYKVDGNTKGHGGNCGNGVKPLARTPIMLMKLDGKGLKPAGDAVEILDIEDEDGPLVEAPSLVEIDKTYYLFYSSDCYNGPGYRTSYAISRNGLTNGGKHYERKGKLLATGMDGLYGPGGATVDKDGYMVFHNAEKGDNGRHRTLWVGKISFNAGAGTCALDTDWKIDAEATKEKAEHPKGNSTATHNHHHKGNSTETPDHHKGTKDDSKDNKGDSSATTTADASKATSAQDGGATYANAPDKSDNKADGNGDNDKGDNKGDNKGDSNGDDKGDDDKGGDDKGSDNGGNSGGDKGGDNGGYGNGNGNGNGDGDGTPPLPPAPPAETKPPCPEEQAKGAGQSVATGAYRRIR